MFEQDPSALPTRDLLERAADCRAAANRADADLLTCAQIYADRHRPANIPTRPTRRPARGSHDGRERAVVLGGDGCPAVAEFAVAEFATVIGVSPGVGRDLIADALALRHRFPRIWHRIELGEATPWKARQIVRACHKLDHSAAEYVDRRVASIVDTISPYRLEKIVQAAKLAADPQLAADEAAEAAEERGVFVGRGDKHGNKTIYIKAPAAAVNRHDAAIADIAEALKTLGDTRSIQHRRADAVGILPDHRFTQELLDQADRTHQTQPPNSHRQPPNPDLQGSSPDLQRPSPGHIGSSPAGSPAKPTPNSGADHGLASSRNPSSDRNAGSKPPSSSDRDTGSNDSREPVVAHATEPSSLLEPTGPLDDPWLEAAGPADPEPSADPYLGRAAAHEPDAQSERDPGSPMDDAALRAFAARLAQIKQDAHAREGMGGRLRAKQVRPGQTEVVVHLTDHTLATGNGVLRAESVGPLLAAQLTELIGYGPYIVKPVLDLNDAVSVNAYEIPARIRERVKLIHPVELFPYGTRETTNAIDLDHIQPYDPHGPSGQTSTTNLAPLGRFGHRVKTHARGWSVRRIDFRTLEWTTPHGFTFHVDPAGTRRCPTPDPNSQIEGASPRV